MAIYNSNITQSALYLQIQARFPTLTEDQVETIFFDLHRNGFYPSEKVSDEWIEFYFHEEGY